MQSQSSAFLIPGLSLFSLFNKNVFFLYDSIKLSNTFCLSGFIATLGVKLLEKSYCNIMLPENNTSIWSYYTRISPIWNPASVGNIETDTWRFQSEKEDGCKI